MTYIYAEGDKGLRAGFQKLFERFSRVKVYLLDDKDNARKVWNKHRTSGQDCHLLLVDSDGPAEKTAAEGEFFMVQEMESWFLVDLELLESYYGQRA